MEEVEGVFSHVVFSEVSCLLLGLTVTSFLATTFHRPENPTQG